MRKEIHKFELEVAGLQWIKGHPVVRWVSAQNQNDRAVVWAVVDTDKPVEETPIISLFTGAWFDVPLGSHIGTVQLQDGKLVVHVFAHSSCVAQARE